MRSFLRNFCKAADEILVRLMRDGWRGLEKHAEGNGLESWYSADAGIESYLVREENIQVSRVVTDHHSATAVRVWVPKRGGWYHTDSRDKRARKMLIEIRDRVEGR